MGGTSWCGWEGTRSRKSQGIGEYFKVTHWSTSKASASRADFWFYGRVGSVASVWLGGGCGEALASWGQVRIQTVAGRGAGSASLSSGCGQQEQGFRLSASRAAQRSAVSSSLAVTGNRPSGTGGSERWRRTGGPAGDGDSCFPSEAGGSFALGVPLKADYTADC